MYDNSASKRRSSYLSFSIKTQEEWEEAMLFCQSNKERIAMHTIRGSNSKGRALEAMKAIYALDPQIRTRILADQRSQKPRKANARQRF